MMNPYFRRVALCNSLAQTSRLPISVLLVVAILLLGSFTITQAQQEAPTPTPTPTPPPTPTPTPSPTPPPTATPGSRVLEVANYNYRNAEEGREKRSAGLDNIIIITVRNLEALVQEAKKCPPQEPDCKPKEIALFLNGRVLKGLTPESGAPTLDTNSLNGKLTYHLDRVAKEPYKEDAQEQWGDLLGLSYEDLRFTRQVEVSVGLADSYPIPTDVKIEATAPSKQFYLIRVRAWRLVVWAILLAFAIYFFLQKAWYSELLRDRTPVYWGKQKPYSLSACQAAWWFLLIIVSFVFIWLVTGQYDLSQTALVLISVGFGTALGATVIDSNKRDKPADTQTDGNGLQQMLAELQQLGAELTKAEVEHGKGSKEFTDAQTNYDNKFRELKAKFPNAIGSPHEDFLTDILSDASGISFHRYQMLIWTVVLGIFFVYKALGRLAMPDFDQTLLALMGISAGTYLGFKIPESSSAPLPPSLAASDQSDGKKDETKTDETKTDETKTDETKTDETKTNP